MKRQRVNTTGVEDEEEDGGGDEDLRLLPEKKL